MSTQRYVTLELDAELWETRAEDELNEWPGYAIISCIPRTNTDGSVETVLIILEQDMYHRAKYSR